MGKYAIIIVMTVLVSLSIYGQGLQRTWLAADLAAVELYNQSQARNIAQSSAMAALQKIIVKEDANFKPEEDQTILIPASADSFRTWPAMRGAYQYRIRNWGDSLITVATRSSFRDSEYEVEVVLQKGSGDWNPDLSHTVFARTSISMTGNSRIVGDAGTNSIAYGAIDMGGGARIDSSVSIGPGGNPNFVVVGNRNIGGEIVNMSSIKTFPLPDFPEFPAKSDIVSSQTISGGGRRPVVWSPTNYDGKYIPSLNVRSTLQLDTGNMDRVLHVGDLNIDGNLDVLGTGKLTIYVENTLEVGGTVNQYRLPETMFVYYKGTDELRFAGGVSFGGGLYAETANITLTGNSLFQGNIITGGNEVRMNGTSDAISRVIYAPNAAVILNGTARLKGTVVCNTFSSVGNARVTSSSQSNDTFPDFSANSNAKMVVLRWR